MKNNNTKKIEYITYSQKILERIKIELTRQKISQKTLAQLCNVSQPTISKLLKGDSPLTLEFIYKVSEKLDIPIETLLSTPDTYLQSEFPDNLPVAFPPAISKFLPYFRRNNDDILSLLKF